MRLKILFFTVIIIGFSCISNHNSIESNHEEFIYDLSDTITKKKSSDLTIGVDLPTMPNTVSNRIVDEFWKLPEIEKWSNYADSVTERNNSLFISIDEFNDSLYDYQIIVAFTIQMKIDTIHTLYIDTINYQLMIKDAINNDIINFETWRKR